MPGQGRLGDKANVPLDTHGCPACPHPAIGPAIQGSPDVQVNRRPALRVDDTGIHAACCGTNSWTATKGSLTVLINGKGAHRKGDQNRHCGGLGQLVEGSPNVIVGESSGGGVTDGGGAGAGGGSRGAGGFGANADGGGSGATTAKTARRNGGDVAGSPVSTVRIADHQSPAPRAPDDHHVQLVLRFLGWDGGPQAGKRYRIEAHSTRLRGTTDSGGMLREQLPPGTRHAILVWGDDAELWTIELDIAPLPDVADIAGIQARLRNLGYLPAGYSAGTLDEWTREAVRQFQVEHEVTDASHASGDPDDATRLALKDIHGC